MKGGFETIEHIGIYLSNTKKLADWYMNIGHSNIAAFSVCRVLKRDPIINIVEYHSYCGEILFPLDGDVGLAIPNAEVPLDKIKVYYIPKGTIVSMCPGIWHYAPFAYKCDVVNILVGVTERIHTNDCTIVEIPKEKK